MLIDEVRGEVSLHKVPTTVVDPSLGAITGLQKLCVQAGLTPALFPRGSAP